MTITRKQVADLRAGDVVSLLDTRWPPGTECGGPLWHDEDTGALRCGTAAIRYADGGVPWTAEHRYLTVISRAPRPLYVNHDRTKPVPGDVARDADGKGATFYRRPSGWFDRFGVPVGVWAAAGFRLLVDGTTGETVPKFRSHGQVVQ